MTTKEAVFLSLVGAILAGGVIITRLFPISPEVVNVSVKCGELVKLDSTTLLIVKCQE